VSEWFRGTYGPGAGKQSTRQSLVFHYRSGDFFQWNGLGGVPFGQTCRELCSDLYNNPEILLQAFTRRLFQRRGGTGTNLDESLGLYVDARGYFQGVNGSDVKFLRGANNSFGNPWYFLRQGAFYAWNGVDTSGPPLAIWSVAFEHPELLYQASQETLAGADLAQAQTSDQTLGLDVDPAGFCQVSGNDINGSAASTIPSATPGTSSAHGEFGPWSGSGTSGTVLYTFPTAAFRKPELIYQASTVTLSAPKRPRPPLSTKRSGSTSMPWAASSRAATATTSVPARQPQCQR